MKNLKKLIFGQLLLVIALVLFFSTNLQATVYTLDLALSGQNEIPFNSSTATGTLTGTYDNSSNVLSINLMFNGLTGPTTGAHFHGPATPETNGPIVIPLEGFPMGVTLGSYSNSIALSSEQESQMLCGMWYVNIHTSAFPGGEIRAQLKEGMASENNRIIEVVLSGQNEAPQNPSPASGILMGTYNDVTNILRFNLAFNGLTGLTTGAHIHGPALPGVNGPVIIPFGGFPMDFISGTYSNSFTLTPVQESQLLSGLLYVNIHTAAYPGGEIRAQLEEVINSGNIKTFALGLRGQNEAPANPTTATGIFMGLYDDATNVLSFNLMFNGLAGPTTAAHFHGPAAPGVNGPILIPLTGFPIGTSDSYSNILTLTPNQEILLLSRLLYVNIHTQVYPGGEIRGQLEEGTLTGDCQVETIPVANWALLLGGLLIGAYSFFMIRRRS